MLSNSPPSETAVILDGERPRLRPLELKWLVKGDAPTLFMRDPTGIAPGSATVPHLTAVVLGLCDGDHDLPGICAAFEVRTGETLSIDVLRHLIDKLDEALFLESPRYFARRDAELHAYRSAAFRPPVFAGRVYPADAS